MASIVVKKRNNFLNFSLKGMSVMDIFMRIFKKRQCFLSHLLIKIKIVLLKIM
jgi:hypothetical protein